MKNDIRNKLILERKSLTKSVKRKLDINLNECLEETFDWMGIKKNAKVLAFYPLNNQNEVNILPFLDYLQENGIQLYFPRISNDNLEIVKIVNLDELIVGKYGLYEPNAKLKASEIKDFDLILVPGVAFCKNCFRIGYGKGYYDKLLKTISGTKMGIAYDFQVLDSVPTEDHDIKLDIVITETGIYKS